MSVAVNTSGTQAATISTEHVLATVASGACLQLLVDVNAMVNGDVVEIRVYGKVLSGGTERVMFRGTYGPGIPAEKIVFSPPVISPHHFKATLKQTAGTGRSFPWAIYNT